MRHRQLIRIILTLLLLPLLGFGAVKGYYWYQVRSAVEQVAQQLSLFAKLEYGAIETGFDGKAGVRNLTLTPLGQEQGISIDAVRVKAASVFELMGMRSRLDKGELPQSLAFEVQGISVDLTHPMLTQLAAQASEMDGSMADWMLGCEVAAEGLSDIQLLQKLGYQQLVLNLSMSYRFDKATKLLTLSLQESMPDHFDFEMDSSIDLGINEFNRYNLALANPSLGQTSLHYRDRSFNQRHLSFCAKATGESVAQFVDRHVGLERESARELGLVLSDSLVVAYRDFLLGNGDVQLQMLEGQSLQLASLLQYSPEQLLELFGFSLTVNGKKIEPLSIAWEPSEELAEPLEEQMRSSVEAFTSLLQAPFVEPEPEVDAGVDQVLLQAPPINYSQASGYQTTELDQLQAYLGSSIRIETKNGHLVEGRLLRVRSRELRIYQEVGLGDAILPIAFKHIAAVQVYR
ncbi:MAG: hypothetical protein V7752_01545 [Halopseudomonas sp.]